MIEKERIFKEDIDPYVRQAVDNVKRMACNDNYPYLKTYDENPEMKASSFQILIELTYENNEDITAKDYICQLLEFITPRCLRSAGIDEELLTICVKEKMENEQGNQSSNMPL